ncbi:hypothetical protein BC831DRAFT_189095 [Entophlyctis helioformis]|nr:hypothetical protein BC831DRAFT_189095 [Entophlyctis helioformis]
MQHQSHSTSAARRFIRNGHMHHDGIDVPSDLTKAVKLGANTIDIALDKRADNSQFSLAVTLVAMLTFKEALVELEANEKFTIQESAKLASRLFVMDDDLQTVSTASVSLKCPVVLTRIKKAARGRDCTHIMCFDLDNLLRSHEAGKKIEFCSFTCPVCSIRLSIDKIRIDPFMQFIIDHTPEDVLQVFLNEDASWSLPDDPSTRYYHPDIDPGVLPGIPTTELQTPADQTQPRDACQVDLQTSVISGSIGAAEAAETSTLSARHVASKDAPATQLPPLWIHNLVNLRGLVLRQARQQQQHRALSGLRQKTRSTAAWVMLTSDSACRISQDSKRRCLVGRFFCASTHVSRPSHQSLRQQRRYAWMSVSAAPHMP